MKIKNNLKKLNEDLDATPLFNFKLSEDGKTILNFVGAESTVVIPDGITTIGKAAFNDQQSVHRIVIPDSVTTIEAYAFNNCRSLLNIAIGRGVTKIGDEAFYNCKALNSVHIKNIESWCNIDFSTPSANPLRFDANLFLNGATVTDLVVPTSVSKIRAYAFLGCGSLESVTVLNGGATSIERAAFNGCKKLWNVAIGNNVTKICSLAFQSCRSLSRVVLWKGLKTIEFEAFADCPKLTSIIIPDSLSSVGNRIFGGSGLNLILCYKEDKSLLRLGATEFEDIIVSIEALKETYNSCEKIIQSPEYKKNPNAVQLPLLSVDSVYRQASVWPLEEKLKGLLTAIIIGDSSAANKYKEYILNGKTNKLTKQWLGDILRMLLRNLSN